jgi:hypothetical protein
MNQVGFADVGNLNNRYYREDIREPALHEQGQTQNLGRRYIVERPPATMRERPPPPESGGDSPIYVRTVPRHQVIALE